MSVFLDCTVAIATLLMIVYGLTLVLGVLEVINLAHAGFMAIGVYAATALIGHGWSFAAALGGSVIVTALVGAAVERLIVRRLYHRPVDTILATWGVGLIIVQIITIAFGSGYRTLNVPLTGSANILGTPYSAYQLLIVVVAAAVFVALTLISKLTEVGRTVRMVMSNEPMAQGLGINTTRVRQVTFTLGAALAGLGGAMLGPLQGVSPQYATSLLIPAFLAVLVAGASLSGLLISCAVLATIETLFSTYANPSYSVGVLVLSAVIILRFAPSGLGIAR